MARENYSYKKYQRELAQKKKREAKMQSRLAKKSVRVNGDSDPAPDGGTAITGPEPHTQAVE